MTKIKPDHDLDPDPNHDNDNGASKSPAAASRRARSLPCADGAGGDVQRRSTPRPSAAVRYMPMLQFKSATSGGIWTFGQRRTVPEPGSRGRSTRPPSSGAASASATATRYSAKRLVSVSEPMPDVTKLPDKGFPWQQQMGGQPEVRLDGTDAGTEVVSTRPTPTAAREQSSGLIEAVRDRLNGDQHDGKVSPIVLLEKLLLPASAVRQDLDRRC